MSELVAPRRAFLRLARPSEASIEAELRANTGTGYSYTEQGGTRGDLPEGWRHDDRSVELGRGEGVWLRARDALDRWVQFDLGWVRLHEPPPIEEGTVVAFTSRQLGLWTLNLCRIVYVVDDDRAEGRSYGFAYGTLANHAVAGEELFLLRQDADGAVTFRIAKFSRPAHPLVWLSGPLATHIQERFTRDALARMKAEVEGP